MSLQELVKIFLHWTVLIMFATVINWNAPPVINLFPSRYHQQLHGVLSTVELYPPGGAGEL